MDWVQLRIGGHWGALEKDGNESLGLHKMLGVSHKKDFSAAFHNLYRKRGIFLRLR